MSTSRIFCKVNTETGLDKWFFNTREGVSGPFFSKAAAASGLENFIKICISAGNDGNRVAKMRMESKDKLINHAY